MSPTSSEASTMSRSIVRWSSSGSVVIAASAVRKPSRASAYFPSRALASARHSGASCWLPTNGFARSFMAASGRPIMMLAMARSTDRRRVLGRGRVVGDRDVEHRFRLGIHVAGEVEAREIAARRETLGFRSVGGGEHELRPALGEIGLAVEPPGLEIEHVAMIQRLRGRFRHRRESTGLRAARSPPCRPTNRR